MDAQRAQEICNSPTMVNVTYNGSPIYIEHVDQGNGSVTIHLLDNPDQKRSIPVNHLVEEH